VRGGISSLKKKRHPPPMKNFFNSFIIYFSEKVALASFKLLNPSNLLKNDTQSPSEVMVERKSPKRKRKRLKRTPLSSCV
jgi:hypothetical protein